MNILVIDGQGGGLGRQIIDSIKKNIEDTFITAVGTNSVASAAMLKAGADVAVTGENSVIVACRTTDVIVGPIGIVVADSLYGELTPKMAAAVGSSLAPKILVPVNHCNNIVVGVPDLSMGKLLEGVVAEIQKLC